MDDCQQVLIQMGYLRPDGTYDGVPVVICQPGSDYLHIAVLAEDMEDARVIADTVTELLTKRTGAEFGNPTCGGPL